MKKQPIKFIFIHIPKTGGTTFRKSVISKLKINHFRENKDKYNLNKSSWFMDYYNKKINFDPIFKNKNELFKYDVISGHFRASKYSFLKYPLITWVRNPTDRLISHYYNWLYKCNHIDSYKDKEKLVWYDSFKNGMDIVEFSKAFGNHMSFFFDVDFNLFKFIGILEYYNKSLDHFENIFRVKVSKVNVIYNKFKHPILNNDIRNNISKNQKKDFDLYYKCIDKYKKYKEVKYYGSS